MLLTIILGAVIMLTLIKIVGDECDTLDLVNKIIEKQSTKKY